MTANPYAIPCLPRRIFAPLVLAVAVAAMLAWPVGPGTASANPVASSTAQPDSAAAPKAPASAPAKDVVLDDADSVPASNGRLVPTPATRPEAAGPADSLHDTVAAAALGDLALALMRHQAAASGQAQTNMVLSPLSVASALGLVHAASAGETARELAALMDPATAGDRYFRQQLPRQITRLGNKADSPLTIANRLWVGTGLAPAIPDAFAALVTQRLRADASIVDFTRPEPARVSVNAWVTEHTGGRVPALLPPGSVRPGTQAIVTNAVHFKARWAEPFDPDRTRNMPFTLGDGTVKQVPTMSAERQVLQGTIGGMQVMALPFAGGSYQLVLAMAPAGHTLDAAQTAVSGLDMAIWPGELAPATCRLLLPRFSLQGSTVRLKSALQALGVRTAFGDGADFTPLAGAAGRALALSEVFHSANIVIDEAGGEASAATAVVADVKSFRPPAPRCAVDRPFLFSIVHLATQTPVFVGKVADPSAG